MHGYVHVLVPCGAKVVYDCRSALQHATRHGDNTGQLHCHNASFATSAGIKPNGHVHCDVTSFAGAKLGFNVNRCTPVSRV